MKKNNFKYTYIVEGECEKKLLLDLKTKIFINKTISECKACKNQVSNVKKGTITIKDLKKFNNKCKCKCKKIIICDYDMNEDIIDKINNYCFDNNLIIISKPRIEIVLLAIFTNKLNIAECEIDKQISKFINIKYKHNTHSINKIIKHIEFNKKLLNSWIKNLEYLNKNGRSNFIELILWLKGENNEIK